MNFLLIALLGFASGLPLALTSSTLQAWATEQGLSLMTIGALSFVGQAYAFKVLWAPLVDRRSLPLIRGLRRSWMVWCQLGIALGLALIATCHLPQQFEWIILLAIIVAIFSATFDTVFDAFRIEYVAQKDYGLANAIYISSYRIAMLVSGGLALVAASYYGWHIVYAWMAGLALVGAGVSYCVPIRETDSVSENTKPGFWTRLNTILTHKKSILMLVQAANRLMPRFGWVVAFIFLYKFGEAFGTALSTSFLLRVGHFSLVQIGITYKTCGLLATLSGGFIGAIAYRYGSLRYLLLIFGILQAVSIAWYIPIAAGKHSLLLMMLAVGFEAGCAGMATTVFVSFMMRLCHKEYVATQFALLAALAAIGRIVTGPMAAWMIAAVGWVDYYYLSIVISLLALMVLPIIWDHPVFKKKP